MTIPGFVLIGYVPTLLWHYLHMIEVIRALGW